MRALPTDLRRKLESAVLDGRQAAEEGVKAAFASLGVEESKKPGHLDDHQARLRRGLRAKQRQLGGDFKVLVWDAAYEQWHRLLFARFLAENNLLLYPKHKVPVMLAECEDLADELGEPDGWSVAARFAAEILPGIFRLDDPCVVLRLATEHRQALEDVVEGLPAEVFKADDSLGWVYQYWQSERKKQVNASERKIGGADLGPVTQLFTENYMVRFLLENSLGAWWAARYPDSPLVSGFEYLRFDEEGSPAAGTFDGWPGTVAEVTVMDPCCGSGHFLVEAFSMLWRMRAEEERLSPIEAQDAVLRDNLYGLELDPRCVEIAMMAIALTAWKAGGGWRELPVPNIACSGIPVKAPVDEWTALADGDQRLENALVRLHILCRDADTLGSLIDPKRATEITDPTGLQQSFDDVEWDEIAPLLEKATLQETADPATAVLGADAAGIARAADYLSRQYTLITTNPPFLTRSNHSQLLRSHADEMYPSAKHDLATVMLDRAAMLASPGLAFVLPQGWTQLSRYEELRRGILSSWSVGMISFLGPGAFESISGEVVNVVLFAASRSQPSSDHAWVALDAVDVPGSGGKAESLRRLEAVVHRQADTKLNPDARVIPMVLPTGPPLADVASSLYGLRTGDAARLIRNFWEVGEVGPAWRFHQSTTVAVLDFSGRESVLCWEDGRGALGGLAESGIASIQGEGAWGKQGVAVSLMGALPVTRSTGESFDNNCAVVWPRNDDLLAPVWCFLADRSFSQTVRMLDRSLKVTNQTLLKVPFDLEHWSKVAEERFPDGLPEPWSDDPTQWLFEGRPEVSTAPLQVAVARLVGYRWPEQAESDDLDELADTDGIVCLPSVAGEAPAADRVQRVLAVAFGKDWSPGLVRRLLEESRPRKDLENWLRDDFFKQHCKLFKNRPFVWHIWDGRRDGFSALVNYHRLDRPTLERLTYTYLGDWLERQRSETTQDIAGADLRLAAAQDLKKKLELILEGEPPYDIYVRWKELHEQPIGWKPDLNDGVRLNIRPFVEAGVLCSKFSINWNKDRGKDPDGSVRYNDLHYTTAEKHAAREEARSA